MPPKMLTQNNTPEGPSSKNVKVRSCESTLIRAVKDDNKILVQEMIKTDKQDINAVFDNSKVKHGSKYKGKAWGIPKIN